MRTTFSRSAYLICRLLTPISIIQTACVLQGQLCDFELPMQPITIMRNALGVEEGGSGVPLSREKYRESTAFWIENVAIK